MAYENQERERSVRSFKTIMDIVMGIFYITIGGILVFIKKIGNIDIPGYVAYSLGPIMIIGGVFRFHRGFKDMRPAKKDSGE